MRKRKKTELQQTNLLGILMFKFRNLLKIFWKKYALICMTDKACILKDVEVMDTTAMLLLRVET